MVVIKFYTPLVFVDIGDQETTSGRGGQEGHGQKSGKLLRRLSQAVLGVGRAASFTAHALSYGPSDGISTWCAVTLYVLDDD